MEEQKNRLLQELEILDEQFLGMLRKAIDTVTDQGVSNYPIIVVYEKKLDFELGLLLEMGHGLLEFKISTLEELYVKNIMDKEKVNNFRAVFNHKIGNLCVLIVSEDFADFVFLT